VFKPQLLTVGSVVGAMALALTCVACSLVAGPQANMRTPFPAQSGDKILPLSTQAPATPPPSGVTVACPVADYGSITMLFDGTDVTFVQGSTQTDVPLIWPRGFSLVQRSGVAMLLAPDGSVVLQSGQSRDDIGSSGFDVCLVGETFYAPSE